MNTTLMDVEGLREKEGLCFPDFHLRQQMDAVEIQQNDVTQYCDSQEKYLPLVEDKENACVTVPFSLAPVPILYHGIAILGHFIRKSILLTGPVLLTSCYRSNSHSQFDVYYANFT
jgi:hypothetical protein